MRATPDPVTSRASHLQGAWVLWPCRSRVLDLPVPCLRDIILPSIPREAGQASEPMWVFGGSVDLVMLTDPKLVPERVRHIVIRDLCTRRGDKSRGHTTTKCRQGATGPRSALGRYDWMGAERSSVVWKARVGDIQNG